MEYFKFHYFGDRSKARTNVITVATLKTEHHIIFAFSCSNKKDIYDKKLGKLKAISKVKFSPHSFTLMNCEQFNTYHKINQYLRNFIKNNPQHFPSWAKTVV